MRGFQHLVVRAFVFLLPVLAAVPADAQGYRSALNPPAMLNPLCGAIQTYACAMDRNPASLGYGKAYLVGTNASSNFPAPSFQILIAAFDAPGNLSWSGTYGPGQARAVAVDSQGALVVATTTGVLRFPIGSPWSSYSLSGVTPQEIAFDTSDNVYVTGYTGTSQQIYTVRLDKTAGGGLTLASGWPRYAGNTGGANEGRAIAVQGTSVYVAGTGYRASTGQDALVLKYPLSGGTPAEFWYDGSVEALSDDGFNDLAVDSSGNVFATGYLNGATEFSGFDYLTLKLAAGSFSTPAWLARYDAPGQTHPTPISSTDKARFLALDPSSSSLYVTGSSTVNGSNIVTLKYSAAAGAQQAIHTFDGGAVDDAPAGLFVSSAGQVFVGGVSGTRYVLLARSSDLSSAVYGTPSYVTYSTTPAVACMAGRNTSGAPALFSGGVSRVSSPPACDPQAATGIQWVYP